MDNSKLLTESDILNCAKELHLEPACIKAVLAVETNGKGFLPTGDPVILFEGHIFWQQLVKRNIKPENYTRDNSDILYPKWTKQYYFGGIKEYSRLLRAKLINEEAALCSTSFGLFQIMGFNFHACGFNTVKDFVSAMELNEGEQLKAFAKLLKFNGWLQKLQDKDWAGFARCYNGPGYAQNQYDKKLEQAYNKFSKI
jgi:hypothetical protein